ncbi:hippurate hydrolase [Boeremia exigua]|uniref:hippurate hydrolase n=1 Tax=Boeremia exigua TaxID=749465 RepID=UPI001E8DE613|nr:hippurate hydrolase [Boeremia exigua]KAH6642822.1 hippurate hydrolase [Boeremia exigua]
MGSKPWEQVVRDHKLDLSRYEDFYKDLHRNPELSRQEYKTAAKITKFLQVLEPNLEIRTAIGGTGLIATFRNGLGKTLLLRADMDALPLLEKTGLDYASKEMATDPNEIMVPVAHACGHDFHVTCLLGAAETLISCRKAWSGTLVFLFQPAEEGYDGAKAMVDDGLYTRHECPIPDLVLGQHVGPLRAGMVSLKKGPLLAASDVWKITIHGRGGHGSSPQNCIDPIVVAAHIVVRLQTIVSREVPPNELAVVSVCSLHAGSAQNIISDTAELLLNIRSMSAEWRTQILESADRIIRAECTAGNCPKPPDIEHTHSVPMVLNKGAAIQSVADGFASFFGQNYVRDFPAVTGSEDFSNLATAVNVPYCFWFFGGHERSLFDKHFKADTITELPINHSPYFAPAIHPTLQTGIDALVVAVLVHLYRY